LENIVFGGSNPTTLSRITPQCQRIKTSRPKQPAPLSDPQPDPTNPTAHCLLTVAFDASRNSSNHHDSTSIYFILFSSFPSNTTSAFNKRITPLGVVGLSRSTVIAIFVIERSLVRFWERRQLFCPSINPHSVLWGGGLAVLFLCPGFW
jgi:hypothetical protein